MEFTANKKGKLSKIALEQCQDLSYSALMKLLRNKDVKINDKRVSQDVIVDQGDKIIIYYTPKKQDKYSVIFQDENVLVVYKKSGYTSESVFEDVSCKFKSAFFIHRLDRNTAGIMVFALNQVAEKHLLIGFKNRTFNKKYLATVYGVPSVKQAVLTAYLIKDANASFVKIYNTRVNDSVKIVTEYRVLEEYDDTSLLEVALHTGKTHQIRAHLAHVGHFIIGDGKYGDNRINKQKGVKTQKLIAYYLQLRFEKDSPLYYLNGKSFIYKD